MILLWLPRTIKEHIRLVLADLNPSLLKDWKKNNSMKSPNAIGDNVKIFICLYDVYLEDGFFREKRSQVRARFKQMKNTN